MSTANDDLIRVFYNAKKEITEDYCYAIDSEWWKTWQFLIDLKIENPDCIFSLPETLSNKKLISKTKQMQISEGKEKVFYPIEKNLKYNEEYNLVNKEIWDILVDKFQAKFPIILFTAEKSLISPELACLTHQDEMFLDENKIALLDMVSIKIAFEGKQQKSLQLAVPQQITFEKLGCFVKKELEFSLDLTTKIKFKENTLTFKEIMDKRLSELELNEDMTISFSNKGEENVGLLDEENLNYNRDQNHHGANANEAGNLNLETDVSSGNADVMHESVKTMSTNITNELGPFDEKDQDRELDNLFLNDNNINFNIEGLDRKAQIFIDPAKLKEKYLDIKSNERIRLEKKEIHEIKRNLNKLFKEYNFRKLKMKQQNKL